MNGAAIPTAIAAVIGTHERQSGTVSATRAGAAEAPAAAISRLPTTARNANEPGTIATMPGKALLSLTR